MLGQHRTLAFLPFVSNQLNFRSPLLKFTHPIVDRGQRDHDQEGALVVLVFNQVSEQRDALDGLAEAHLIREDAVEAFVNASGGRIANEFTS